MSDRKIALLHRESKEMIGPLTHRELFIAGVVAYWAEGAKNKPWRRNESVAFINSDPGMIQFFLAWLEGLGVSRLELSFRVSIHESADVASALRYWSTLVDAPLSSFRKTARKHHNPSSSRMNKGRDYRGCLIVKVRRSIDLNRRIEGWFAGITATICDGVIIDSGASSNGRTSHLGCENEGSTPSAPATLFERPLRYAARIAG